MKAASQTYRECWNSACVNAVRRNSWLCLQCWQRVPKNRRDELRKAIEAENWDAAIHLQVAISKELAEAA